MCEGCTNKKAIRSNGKIAICCGDACYQQWDAAGRKFVPDPCAICVSEDHKVLQCPMLTTEKKEAMKAAFGYTDVFSYYYNINNNCCNNKISKRVNSNNDNCNKNNINNDGINMQQFAS